MNCVNYYVDDGIYGFCLFLIGVIFALIIVFWCTIRSLRCSRKVYPVNHSVRYVGKIDQAKLLTNLKSVETSNESENEQKFIFHNNFDKWKRIYRNSNNLNNRVDRSNLFSVNESIIKEDILGYNDLEFHYRNERITGHKYLQQQLLNFLQQQKMITREEYEHSWNNLERTYKDSVDEFNYQCDSYIKELRSKAPKNTSESEMQSIINEKFPLRADQLMNDIITQRSTEIREKILNLQTTNNLSKDDVNAILSMYINNKARLDQSISDNKNELKQRMERRLENLKADINAEVIDSNVQETGYKERETIFNENIATVLPNMSETERKKILDEYTKNVSSIKSQHAADLLRQKQELNIRMENARNNDLEKIFSSYEKELLKHSKLAEKSSLEHGEEIIERYEKLKAICDDDVNVATENWDQKQSSTTKKLKEVCTQSIEKDIDEMEYDMLQQLYRGNGINNYDVNDILKEHQRDVKRSKEILSKEYIRQMQKMKDLMRKRNDKNGVELNNGIQIQFEEEEKRNQIVKKAMNDQMELPLEMKNKILNDSQSNEINIRDQLISSKIRQQKQLELALAQKMAANMTKTKAPSDSVELAQADKYEEEVSKADIDKESIILEMRDKLANETKMILNQYEDQICNIMAVYQVSLAKKLREKKNTQTLFDNLCKEMSHPAFQQNPFATEQVFEQFNNDKSNLERIKKSAQDAQKLQMEKRLEEQKAKLTGKKHGELKRQLTDQLLAYKESGVSDAALVIADASLVDKLREETEMAVNLELNKEAEYFEKVQEKYDEDIEKDLLDKQKDILSRLVLITDMKTSQISDLIDSIEPNIDPGMKKSILNELKRKTTTNMKSKTLFQFQGNDKPIEEPKYSAREKMNTAEVDGNHIAIRKKKKRMKIREEEPEAVKTDSDF